jgi:hypothetical protein
LAGAPAYPNMGSNPTIKLKETSRSWDVEKGDEERNLMAVTFDRFAGV